MAEPNKKQIQQINDSFHLPVLDGVRGIAALMVMFFHFNYFGDNAVVEFITRVKVIGQTGVDLFFVLSGFLITRILIRTKSSKNYFSVFYSRRALRIFPLYYGILILVYFIFPISFGDKIPPFTEQIWFWVYLQNIPATFGGFKISGPGHFWSLAVEEHFYLIWPLIIYLIKDKNIIFASVSMIVFSIVLRFIFLEHHISVFYFTFTRLDAIAIGSLLAALECRVDNLAMYKSLFIKMFFVVGFVLSLIWLAVTGLRLDIVQLFKFTFIGLAYFGLIGLVLSANKENILYRFFNQRILRFSRKISYGLYVYHPMVFYTISSLLAKESLLINFATSFLFTFIVAFLSYQFFENKILNFKKKIKYIY